MPTSPGEIIFFSSRDYSSRGEYSIWSCNISPSARRIILSCNSQTAPSIIRHWYSSNQLWVVIESQWLHHKNYPRFHLLIASRIPNQQGNLTHWQFIRDQTLMTSVIDTRPERNRWYPRWTSLLTQTFRSVMAENALHITWDHRYRREASSQPVTPDVRFFNSLLSWRRLSRARMQIYICIFFYNCAIS